MKKSSAEVTFKNFLSNMLWDKEFLKRIEKARTVVRSVDEKRSVFEVFVFSVCANWEIMIEDLLVDCLNKDASEYRKYTGYEIPKNLTRDTCKAIIIGTRYLDYKSVGDIKGIANNILVPGCNPFHSIDSKSEGKIEDFYKIRNYLAHYSYLAERSLGKMYKNKFGLRTFRRPGEFLCAKDRKRKVCRMNIYIDNFIDTSKVMARSMGVNVT